MDISGYGEVIQGKMYKGLMVYLARAKHKMSLFQDQRTVGNSKLNVEGETYIRPIC